MCRIHPYFGNPPPHNWSPQPGERVRLLFQDRTYEGVIQQVLEGPKAFLVSSDDLLLPVVCGKNSLRPIDENADNVEGEPL